MTIEQRVQYLNIVASEDFTVAGKLHKAVALNGTIANNARDVCGFVKSKTPSGAGLRVGDGGVIKVFAGAAVSTVGYPVTVTTSGFVIAAPVGSATIGKAFAVANSGDLFPIQADCANVGVA